MMGPEGDSLSAQMRRLTACSVAGKRPWAAGSYDLSSSARASARSAVGDGADVSGLPQIQSLPSHSPVNTVGVVYTLESPGCTIWCRGPPPGRNAAGGRDGRAHKRASPHSPEWLGGENEAPHSPEWLGGENEAPHSPQWLGGENDAPHSLQGLRGEDK